MKHNSPIIGKRLAALALGAVGISLAATSAHADLTFLGVAAGDATSTEAVLWTRAVDTNAPAINFVVANISTNPSGFGGAIPPIYVIANPEKDYTAKVTATGLKPGTRYYYWFENETNAYNRSIVGTFKTAPAASDAVPVRFAFSGDADGLIRPYNLASQFPSQNLDFFVWLGDTIYETASLGSPAVTSSGNIPGPLTNGATRSQLFNDYSRKYREQFLAVNPDGQKCLEPMFASQGNYTLLDNHELGNKQYINGGAPAGGPVGDMDTGAGVDARVSDFDTNSGPSFMNKSIGFQTLQQVFVNYQPVKDRGFISASNDLRTDGTPLQFYAQQWGQNAIFINVDDRSYRDIRIKTAANADDTGPRAGNPGRTMIGATQLAWLKQTLLDADTAHIVWKFVTVSDPIDQLGPIGGALANTSNGGNTGYATVSSDGGKSWMGGYRAERNDLLMFIADNHIYNVVFLATDDHQNRVNELDYSPTGDTETQSSYVRVPHCFAIVDGPLGATGPDLVTNHTFANNKIIADSIANAQVLAGIDPLGLDPAYPGLHDLFRETDPMANVLRQPTDFYSPDTYNFNTLDVTSDGGTLTVTAIGINSYAQNARPEYDPINNPARTIFSFQVDAFTRPSIACPENITVSNDVDQCSATVNFSAAAAGHPAPVTTFSLNGGAITSPYNFPKGVSTVICTASNVLGREGCSFTVTVLDRQAPSVSSRPAPNPGGKNVPGDKQTASNPNGFFELLSKDNCDPNPQIFVRDSASAFVAGPFTNGVFVKITTDPNATPQQKTIGGAVSTHIILNGAPQLVAIDADGNSSAP
jgi:phosphodiesterase/alkaline phosphatase D-like protein